MNLPEEYRDLVEGYLESLEATRAELEALADALARDDGAALPALRAIAHKLAGNGASFGFPEITEAAKAVTRAARAFMEAPALGSAGVADRARALARVCATVRSEFTAHR